MSTTITSKGQVTIPKHIRDSVDFTPGTKIDFQINDRGRVELVKEGEPMSEKERRFRSAIGSATIKWDTDELMALLRGED
jgi:AbrB family looped-hinge helix DNA binding protein